jgi:hypothetical protein
MVMRDGHSLVDSNASMTFCRNIDRTCVSDVSAGNSTDR